MERKTYSQDYKTPLGVLTIHKDYLVVRDRFSDDPKGQVCQEMLERTRMEADGDWFTMDMAEELGKYLLTGGEPPAWLKPA